MIHVGFAISHVDSVPERRAWVSAIRREVPRASVVKDTKRNLWDTTRRTWVQAAREPDATHVVAMQDDMIPCKNFLKLLYGAIEARPYSVICYFSMRKAIPEARKEGLSWVVIPDATWGGTTVLTRDTMYDFLLWEMENVDPAYKWDDRRLALYCIERGLPVFVTAPSLVQHEGADQSLVGNGGIVARRRRSQWVADGSPVDWATDALRIAGTLDPGSEWIRARRKR